MAGQRTRRIAAPDLDREFEQALDAASDYVAETLTLWGVAVPPDDTLRLLGLIMLCIMGGLECQLDKAISTFDSVASAWAANRVAAAACFDDPTETPEQAH